MSSTSVTVTEQKRNGYDAGHPDPCRTPDKSLSFNRIDQALHRLPLHAGERETLREILHRDFLIDGARKGYVYASNPSLAGATSKSRRTILRHLAKFRRLRLLHRDPHNPRKLHIHYEQLFRLAFGRTADGPQQSAVSFSVTVKCPGCGEAFSRSRSNRRYCSAACRLRAWRRQQKRICTNRFTSLHKPFHTSSAWDEDNPPQGCHGETVQVTSVSPPEPEQPPKKPQEIGLSSTSPPPLIKEDSKDKEDFNDNVQRLVAETEAKLKNQKLLKLCRRRGQLRRLFAAFNPEPVLRAIRQADLQYRSSSKKIKNAYGLIHHLCREGLDDTLLEECERKEAKRREGDKLFRYLCERPEVWMARYGKAGELEELKAGCNGDLPRVIAERHGWAIRRFVIPDYKEELLALVEGRRLVCPRCLREVAPMEGKWMAAEGICEECHFGSFS